MEYFLIVGLIMLVFIQVALTIGVGTVLLMLINLAPVPQRLQAWVDKWNLR